MEQSIGAVNSKVQEQYDKLLKKWKRITLLDQIANLLGWDQKTGMPIGEGAARAEQESLLAGLIHERMVDGELSDIIDNLAAYDAYCELPLVMSANVREAVKSVRRESALPADLVVALAKETSLASEVWQKARKENSFKDFAPSLQKIVSLLREKAAAYMAAGIGKSPYEALFSDYESGIPLAEVDAIFDKLRAELPPLVKTIASLEPPDDSFLFKHYPKDLQEKVSREIVTTMGLDWNRCRLDISTHPFTCSPAYASPRITSRYDENNLMDALFSAIHEAGHALYEQGLPEEWAYQPIGNAVGLTAHESQSRFWDAWFCRSHSFWLSCLDKVRDTFPEQLKTVTAHDFYRAVNRVKLGFIRVDADPLTYNLHILLRYDIEKMMMESDFQVDSLPAVWNDRFEHYFGVRPPTDREGILQDVHWSLGSIGYFPTYTLGNIFSAQLFEEVEKDLKLWRLVYNQNYSLFDAIREWLKEKVHKHGSLYETQDLITAATGQPLSAEVFMRQLKARYSDVYSINLS